MLISTRKIITAVITVSLLLFALFSASCGFQPPDTNQPQVSVTAESDAQPDENLPEPETQGLVKEVNCDMKILFLGNSITLHSPAPDIGWTGNWGMAASSEENDYVHKLCSMLTAAGYNPIIHIRNVAEFERDPAGISPAYFDNDLAFMPDVVIFRMCENTPAEQQEAFAAAYEELICRFRADTGCAVIAVGPFWENNTMENLMRDAADRCGAVWLSLSSLHGDITYQAVGQFEHSGVASHPSDKGMQAIADIIFEGMKSAGLISEK
jgi:hypothetical protein